MLDPEVSDDMRRLPALSLTFLAVLALAGCSASAAPGWTYAPVPSASAGASGAPSGAPSTAPSAAPSVAPSVAASVAPSASAGESASASGGAAALTVTAPVGAVTGGFQPKTLEAPATTAFTIHFDNQDNQPHNVQVKGPAGEVALGGDTAFFTGPGTRDYAVPALPAGAYTYYCVVHPGTMTGTLTVK
jgi:plastocyanin